LEVEGLEKLRWGLVARLSVQADSELGFTENWKTGLELTSTPKLHRYYNHGLYMQRKRANVFGLNFHDWDFRLYLISFV
jgi:hypothetical protein